MSSGALIRLNLAGLIWLLVQSGAWAQVQPCEPCLDLAPRGAPDGMVTVGDVIVLQRLVVGIDLASLDEQRRGDVAPALPDEAAAALGEIPTPVLAVGDDALTVGDVVLALRVVTGATSLRLLPDLELSFATPQRACLGSHLTLYGHGLIVGEDQPMVFVAGQPAVVVDLRRGSEHGESLDRITVRESSGIEASDWTEGPVDLLIRTGRGETTLAAALSLAPTCERAPDILALDPPTDGSGETIRVSGLDLACVREAEFIGRQTPGLVLSAPVVAVHSSYALDLRVPASPATRERFDVIVRNDCGEDRSPAVFEFPWEPGPRPDATSMAPPEGPATGGFDLLLGGIDLQVVDSIRFGEVELGREGFVLLGNGQLLVPLVPPSALGPYEWVEVDVVVSGGGLADETPLTLLYLGESLPECGTAAPLSGDVEGGTSVIITAALGSRLDGVERVLFGGVPATNLIHPNSSQLAVLTPPFPTATEVEITLEGEGFPPSTCPLPFDYR